jgi:Protein of unknown function (DUF4019)
MRKIGIGSIVTIALLYCAGVGAATAGKAAVPHAVSASNAWLKLVDSGDYSASYQRASSLFKEHVSAADWVQQVSAARKPLGAVISRRIKASQYVTTLPGAPDGQYVVIQYETSFTNKKSAVETVTPMLDQHGHWRVSGYYIR